MNRIWWSFGDGSRMVPEFMGRVLGLMAMLFSEKGSSGTEAGNIYIKK